MQREWVSEDWLFAKIAEPDMTALNFTDRGHIEVFRKLWILRPYDRTNGKVTRIPRLIVPYQKTRKETEDWGD